MANRILWEPGEARIRTARVTAFREGVNRRFGLDLRDQGDLYDWSIRERARFWESVWRFCGIRAEKEWDDVVLDGDRLPGARWFPGARLNFADNLLRRRDDAEAIFFRGENGFERSLTFGELVHVVARLARSLRDAGRNHLVGNSRQVQQRMPAG